MGYQGAVQTFPLKFLVSLGTVGSRNLQEMPNLGIFLPAVGISRSCSHLFLVKTTNLLLP